MKVVTKYIDHSSLTPEEAIERAKSMVESDGSVEVTVEPDTYSSNALSYLAVQKLIGEEQLQLFFDNDPTLYNLKLPALRKQVLARLHIIVDRVIFDNEKKFV